MQITQRYTVAHCEDTGRPALYKSVMHGDTPARVLIAHVEDFSAIAAVLDAHFSEQKKNQK